jgi:Histidine kinase
VTQSTSRDPDEVFTPRALTSTEIRASRARILDAADEARRRLERDLHDGAQQRLVLAAITMKEAQAEARGTLAEQLVAHAFELLQQGLTELRDLARGIHPAALSHAQYTGHVALRLCASRKHRFGSNRRFAPRQCGNHVTRNLRPRVSEDRGSTCCGGLAYSKHLHSGGQRVRARYCPRRALGAALTLCYAFAAASLSA